MITSNYIKTLKSLAPLALLAICALLFIFLNESFFALRNEQYFSFFKWFCFQTLFSLLAWPSANFVLQRAASFVDTIVMANVFGLLEFLIFHFICLVLGFGVYASIGFMALFNLSLFYLGKMRLSVFHIKSFYYLECFKFLLWLVLLAIISTHSSILYGEKLMDFNLLNFFAGNKNWSFIEDPWASGFKLGYYYFGYFLFGQLSYLSSLTTEISFWTSVAWVYVLFILMIWVLLGQLDLKKSDRIGGVILICVSSNMASIVSFFKASVFNYQAFWSNTRVFDGVFFSEFPIWSFLWGDLHPHFMGYPFLVFFITLLFVFYKTHQSQNVMSLFLVALLLPLLIGINSWDAIYFAIFAICSTIAYRNLSWKLWLIVFISIIFSIQINSLISTQRPIFFQFVLSGANNLYQIFLHQGYWWIVIAASLLFVKKFKAPILWLVVYVLLILFAEHIVLMDRLNTIFKTYNIVWIVGGVIVTITIAQIQKSTLKIIIWGTIISGGMLGTWVNLSGVTKHPPIMTENSLDGLAYLNNRDPDLYQMIMWVRQNIPVNERVLSSYSESFSYNQMSFQASTGNPTLLGWPGHVITRGVPPFQIKHRKDIADQILNGRNLIDTVHYLKQFNFKYVLFERPMFDNHELTFKTLARFGRYSFVELLN